MKFYFFFTIIQVEILYYLCILSYGKVFYSKRRRDNIKINKWTKNLNVKLQSTYKKQHVENVYIFWHILLTVVYFDYIYTFSISIPKWSPRLEFVFNTMIIRKFDTCNSQIILIRNYLTNFSEGFTKYLDGNGLN